MRSSTFHQSNASLDGCEPEGPWKNWKTKRMLLQYIGEQFYTWRMPTANCTRRKQESAMKQAPKQFLILAMFGRCAMCHKDAYVLELTSSICCLLLPWLVAERKYRSVFVQPLDTYAQSWASRRGHGTLGYDKCLNLVVPLTSKQLIGGSSKA